MNLQGIIQLLRPKQWIKNCFIFAAIIFSGNFLNLKMLSYNMVTFFLFCLTASSIYIINDIVDIDKDRCHPKKKLRPLPSGKITVTTAIIIDVILIISVITLSLLYLDVKILIIYGIYFWLIYFIHLY